MSLNLFINTSNSNYHNAYSTYGNSIKNNVNNNETYYVIVDDYTATYAPNRLTIVEYYEDGIYARDLVAEKIKEGIFDTSGTNNYTLTSIPEIISIGEKLTANGTTSKNYYVQGTIISITNTTYGNIYIKDEQGNYGYVHFISLDEKYSHIRYPITQEQYDLLKEVLENE
mgnify:CR=1 FL=1